MPLLRQNTLLMSERDCEREDKVVKSYGNARLSMQLRTF